MGVDFIYKNFQNNFIIKMFFEIKLNVDGKKVN